MQYATMSVFILHKALAISASEQFEREINVSFLS